jgi:hypothetical protein
MAEEWTKKKEDGMQLSEIACKLARMEKYGRMNVETTTSSDNGSRGAVEAPLDPLSDEVVDSTFILPYFSILAFIATISELRDLHINNRGLRSTIEGGLR